MIILCLMEGIPLWMIHDTWTGYISDGDAVLAEPEDYMTLR